MFSRSFSYVCRLSKSRPRCIIHKNFSTVADKVVVEHNGQTGLATVTLQGPPVNSLDVGFLANLTSIIKELDCNSDVKGTLLTSKFHGRVFSAGFDILEMYNKDTASLQNFWRTVQDWYLQLYGFGKPLVAAINGHSPAGGCAMALMCDYRVMAAGMTIGLNETQLGIAAPFFFCDLMTRAIGARKTEHALLMGKIFRAEKAAEIGLVDKVVELDNVQPLALAQLTKLAQIPQPAYMHTKVLMRNEIMCRLHSTREDDVDAFVKLIEMPTVQNNIEAYLASLRRKKK